MRHRKREHIVPSNSEPGYTIIRVYNPPGTTENITRAFIPTYSQQVDSVFDENHRKCYPNCGGPFYCFHRKTTYGKLNMLHGYDFHYPNGKREAVIKQGGYVKPFASFSSIPAIGTSGVTVDPFGPTFDEGQPLSPDFDATYAQTVTAGSNGYSKFIPKLEKLNLIESIKELPQTVSMLRSRSKRYSDLGKRYGDSYVAARFGWVPFVRDVYGFCDLVINSELHISRLVHRNGKWSRRSGTISHDHQTSSSELSESLASSYRLPAAGQPVRVTNTVEYEDTSKFVGSFRYYIPGIDRTSFAGRFSALTVLSGLRLTPSNIYHAMPWTWLVDWTTRAGDWVDYYSSLTTDECCCKYAWVTRRVKASSKLSVALRTSFRAPFESSPVVEGSCSGTSSIEYQKICRYGAAPTFSLSGSPLSDKQALILHSIMRGRV